MKPQIKIAFLSGTEDLNRSLIERLRAIYPELPLWVVSDFPPPDPSLKWIRYRLHGSFSDNLRRVRDAVRDRDVRLAGVMLVPSVPFRRMRLVALALSPRAFLAFNENLNHFMLRPAQLPAILRHIAWRCKNTVKFSLHWARKADWTGLYHYAAATAYGWLRPRRGAPLAVPAPRSLAPGITVVIPSRTGRDLLAAQLPAILAQAPDQIVVVDNGSTDGTAGWLAEDFPGVEVEHSQEALSFARAVNRGIARARHSHVCLLNNDMSIEPGFFAALRRPFDEIPALFCTTAQIRFPAGVRRQETGKTVFAQFAPTDFPVRSDDPLPGEDASYVLYGSGGCSLYDTAKLSALGNLDEVYDPAYVEDLDLGYRAWQRGWPSVYAACAVVEHRHRTTTSRFYTQAELDEILERNYLRFVGGAVAAPAVFLRLWRQALRRLFLNKGPIHLAAGIARQGRPAALPAYSEDLILALTSGAVSVFPGRAASGKPRVLIATPYVPYPLSHGGAVRMYNLMRRASSDFDQILVAFTEDPVPPPPEVLAIFAEVVLVHRPGSHELPPTARPEAVEEFSSLAFRAAMQQTIRKWRPFAAQLEFTQMAQYARDCAPARTILVEHDITFDLYQQMLRSLDTPDLRRELALWRSFETQAWSSVDRVVAMSEQDRRIVTGARAVILPNGVDLDRYRPAGDPADARGILFIGSFAHQPNVMAVEFFVKEVWPRLRDVTLHIIAGARHERFPVDADLRQPGIQLEGFVSDVRPAYHRAAVVVAPLVASAGTNIKILEAMAMGKAIVSTPAGVNGLDLAAGEDFLLVNSAEEMAAAIERMLFDSEARHRIEIAARSRVERDFSWDGIAAAQRALYTELLINAGVPVSV